MAKPKQNGIRKSVYISKELEEALEKEAAEKAGFIFVDKREMEQQYPIPSAYAAYTRYLNVLQGADKYKKDRS